MLYRKSLPTLIMVYIENPIDSTKKLLTLVSELGKTAGYKVNTQKSRHFSTSTMKYQKQKPGKKIPLDIATRKIKYLGINPAKEVKDLYSDDYTRQERN